MREALRLFFISTLIFVFIIFSSLQIKADSPKILINEVYYDVDNEHGSESDNEWVELYNPSSEAIEIVNWTLTDNKSSNTLPSLTIPSKGFALITGNESTFDFWILPEGVIKVVLGEKIGNGLANAGDRLVLKDNNGQEIDALSYGKDTKVLNPPCPDVKEGYSLERSPYGFDTDQASDFIEQKEPTPGKGYTPPSYSDKVFLNEILPDPEGSDDNEYLELYNDGDEDIDLKGWKISDKTSSKIIGEDIVLSSTIIPAKGYLVIYKREGGVSLNNAGDIITLSNPNGEKVDEREYPSLSEGYAYARDASGNWKETSLPTPGEENQFPESEDDSEGNSPIEGEIQAIKKLALGTRILVQAWVTAEPEILGERVMYIQDKTDGIKVSLDSNNYSKIKLGDYVELACTLEQSRGEYYIKMADTSTLSVLATKQMRPKPVRLSTGEVGEIFEGLLVELFGTVVETSGDTFWLDDNSGKAKIYIKDSTEIERPETPKGSQAEVTGIVSQYGNYKDGTPNFRVLPRYEDDIEILSGTPKENPTGAVLGLSIPLPKELPRTGGDNYTLGLAALLLGITLTSATQATFYGKLHKDEEGIDKN